MERTDLAWRSVAKMFDNDNFTRYLGMERVLIEQGHCILKMPVQEFMLNGFDILHGGIAFSLADSALAFASNSHGRISVSLNSTISYPNSAKMGDVLIAEAKEVNVTNKTGLYDVTVTTEGGKVIALFRGTVYRTSKEFFPNEEN